MVLPSPHPLEFNPRIDMTIKPSVRIHGIRSEAVLAIMIAESVFRDLNLGMVITSVTDGEHSPGSRHYTGEAFDIRTSSIPVERRESARNALKVALGEDFDVVLESTHLHVEYDPKRPY